MGHAGKNKSTVATTLDDEIVAEFERRAELLGKTKGAFLRDILIDWYENGAKPVGKLDELMQRELAREKAAGKQSESRKGPQKKAQARRA